MVCSILIALGHRVYTKWQHIKLTCCDTYIGRMSMSFLIFFYQKPYNALCEIAEALHQGLNLTSIVLLSVVGISGQSPIGTARRRVDNCTAPVRTEYPDPVSR